MSARGQRVRFWWRDDDAGRHSSTLDGLLELAVSFELPLGLAVVPAWLDQRTIDRVRATPLVDVLQHGWAHQDHRQNGQKAIELGGGQPTQHCLEQLLRGRAILERAFGDRFLPVLVPPWNRIEERITSELGGLGYRALSTFADDAQGKPNGLLQINTHLDVIDWRGGRRMKPEPVLQAELEALLARPETTTVGLLTHHLLMRAAEFDRLSLLLSHVARHPAIAWTSPRDLFSID